MVMEGYPNEMKSKDDREIIVFLHYFGGSAASWDWVIKKLSKDYRCIAITLPGFGSSPAMKKPSIQAFAEFVQRDLDSRGIKKYSQFLEISLVISLNLSLFRISTGIEK